MNEKQSDIGGVTGEMQHLSQVPKLTHVKPS